VGKRGRETHTQSQKKKNRWEGVHCVEACLNDENDSTSLKLSKLCLNRRVSNDNFHLVFKRVQENYLGSEALPTPIQV